MCSNNMIDKLKEKYTIVPFIFALVIYAAVLVHLFYSQSLVNPENSYASKTDRYVSDLPLHIELALEEENPSPALLHVVVASLQNNFNIPAEISFIVILTVINVAAILMIRAALKKECYDNTSLQQYRIDAVSVAMLLVSAIVIPFISANWYFLKFSPNPLHNSTYLSCRFFAIPVFFLLFKSYDTYKLNKIKSVKYYVMMAFFATLCMLSKPSFLMAFLPACCWVMFIDLFLTKFKSFWPSFWCGVSFIPAMGVVLWQSIYYFGGETDAEISIVPFGFLIKYISVPEFFINVILGAAFPIYMIFICFKYQHKSFRAKIGFSTWLVGLAVVVVLAESGQRLLDGNMTWTTLIGTFFGFYTGAELLLKNVFPEKETKNGWFLFGIHTLFGIAYIIWLSTGRLYL